MCKYATSLSRVLGRHARGQWTKALRDSRYTVRDSVACSITLFRNAQTRQDRRLKKLRVYTQGVENCAKR